MNITQKQLEQVIREELKSTLGESEELSEKLGLLHRGWNVAKGLAGYGSTASSATGAADKEATDTERTIDALSLGAGIVGGTTVPVAAKKFHKASLADKARGDDPTLTGKRKDVIKQQMPSHQTTDPKELEQRAAASASGQAAWNKAQQAKEAKTEEEAPAKKVKQENQMHITQKRLLEIIREELADLAEQTPPKPKQTVAKPGDASNMEVRIPRQAPETQQVTEADESADLEEDLISEIEPNPSPFGEPEPSGFHVGPTGVKGGTMSESQFVDMVREELASALK